MSGWRQLQILISALIVLVAGIAVLVVLDARRGAFGTEYIASAGKLQTLSQRLAKAAQQASQGNPEAFKQLRNSRDEFSALVRLLAFGGESGGVDLPPTSSGVQPLLNTLDREWGKTEANAALVIAEQDNLIALGKAVRAINASNPAMQELTNEIAALSVQTRGSARQNVITAQLMMLSQRMAKNANNMLAENVVNPEVAFLLGKDTNTFRDTLQGLLQGSGALHIERVSDPEMRGKLGELQAAYEDYRKAVSEILGNQARLVAAKRAAFQIFNDSEALLQAAVRLNGGYVEELEGRTSTYFVLAALGALSLLVLLMVGKVYIDDSRRRALDSERQNRSNQQAILRLLDEIGTLADGDLTARAEVTEEITGAIADSINYAVREMRNLVMRIKNAAQQVAVASEHSRQTATELTEAALRQAAQITEATGKMVAMARSMEDMSKSAERSAEVAQGSVATAKRGAAAVQDTINGMDGMREQIQETAKRIKRLGESSQQIGEIVELINDIAEVLHIQVKNFTCIKPCIVCVVCLLRLKGNK